MKYSLYPNNTQSHTASMDFAIGIAITTAFLYLLTSSVANAQIKQSSRPSSSIADYQEELQLEKLRTAVARERAEQAALENQRRSLEYQEDYRRTYSARMEQERQYDQRSNTIGTVSQAANTVTSIIRQVQVLSKGNPGW
jgi:hypothetical protein